MKKIGNILHNKNIANRTEKCANNEMRFGHEIGPSRVRVLPLGVAAERRVHYFWDYFSFFLFWDPYFCSKKGLSYVIKFAEF